MPDQPPPRTDLRHASGWYAILPPPPPAKRLAGDQAADWIVIGAGVTGLAAARRLGELLPEKRIILIEEFRVGYGASGRNAGFIIDTPHLTEMFDRETNLRVSRLVIAGLAELETRVREHAIECEWTPNGHLTAVVDGSREGGLRATTRMLEDIGEGFEWLEDDALANIVGTQHYHAAVLTPRTVTVNPAAMCRGLGETMPDNVEVFEDSPVLGLRPGNPVSMTCAEGSVRAPNVLLTTNAFITKLGLLKGQVFPMIACASLSRPLNDDEAAAMGGRPDWGITGTATMRRTRSNRILARFGTFYTGDFRLGADRHRYLLASHRKGVRDRYPMLASLDFEHTWAGVFCMTRDWASHFGRLKPGVFVSLGYCGVGLARGTISGRLLAEYALGAESDLISDVRSLSGPARLPPIPLLGLGARARLAWYRWQTRREW